MKFRFTFLLFSFASSFDGFAQKYGTHEFLFQWKPNPTEFIMNNHRSYLTDKEYDQLSSCTSLYFETKVDLFNGKILSLKYSKWSSEYNRIDESPDLTEEVAKKIETVLFDNIKIKNVRSITNSPIPRDTLIYLITLDFPVKKRLKKKEK